MDYGQPAAQFLDLVKQCMWTAFWCTAKNVVILFLDEKEYLSPGIKIQ